jgi:two-component system, chemotaxis family, protein-glutamate methylesterase/glutaminase
MKKTKISDDNKRISLLVVDDSLSFRWILRDIFDGHQKVSIIGEAANGIQGLDLMMKFRPDVIIMDMEMPLMDGMTALQHLMIHTPTPTIMFSSLTKEGTTRSFDALKNGAVDFVCKDSFFQGKVLESLKKDIIGKVLNASSLCVRSQEPFFPDGKSFTSSPVNIEKVIFCEECGSREVVQIISGKEVNEITCSKCGDRIQLNLSTKYIRNNFITFIGAGEGGYANLLNIIPKLSAEMSGSLIVQIYAETDHVDAFAQYLDSISNMRVVRIQDGLIIEGGSCYLASCNENITLKPYSANYTLRCSSDHYLPGLTPMDAAMISITGIFKDHVAGIVLSGNEIDGEKGISAIKKNGGSTFSLNPKYCLCKKMGDNIIKKCSSKILEDESGIVRTIESLHLKAKETVLTA